jgi:hypothetical protein
MTTRSVGELLSESTATGGALGRSRWPGPGWRRLRWTELEERLGELVELYDDARFPCSPSNIWPRDRSWLVYTDWDLRGTKISGDPALMTALAADALLETVPLPS